MSISTSPPATSDPISLSALSLNSTYGAVLIGTFISLMLYGLTVHQTYRYIYIYREDKLSLKTLIVALFLTDTLHSVLCIHLCYHILITERFNPGLGQLAFEIWSLQVMVPVSMVTILLTQGFYARRVHLINSRHIYIVAPVVMCMLCEAGIMMAASIEVFKQGQNEKLLAWLTSAGLGTALLTDVSLSSMLITYLRRNRTGIRRTDSMLNILIVYTINTGLLTSSMCLLCLIFALAHPGSLVYISLSMVTVKCYVNAVLATLNSRQSLRAWDQNSDDFGTLGMVSERRAAGQQPSSVVFCSLHTGAEPPHVGAIYISPEPPIVLHPMTVVNVDGTGEESLRVFTVKELGKGDVAAAADCCR